MTCQKVYKQGTGDDSIKAKVNMKAMPHPYIFFNTAVINSVLEVSLKHPTTLVAFGADMLFVESLLAFNIVYGTA